ncbi:uncharacterized protein F4817DRAFT_314866 [Daldinia loculata]|uniref:uncharacterized protein n=1 Tax=Daldinia loculata TaxID=103429 RepID=UPI0020C34DEF|nr:uncharacterized protein F4817DRAFT_314866 [Daldinia loculata]KAI1648241.1 hypothetical protein F4817DRAFT_314866 [Daldinia loculata]
MSEARKKGRTPLPSLPPARLAEIHNIDQARVEADNATDKVFTGRPQQPQPKATKRRELPYLPCDICGKLLKGPTILKCHKRTVHIGTRCYWGACTQTFISTEELIEHLKDHQTIASTGDKPGDLICHWPGCSHPHSYIHELYRHIRIHNGDMHQSY